MRKRPQRNSMMIMMSAMQSSLTINQFFYSLWQIKIKTIRNICNTTASFNVIAGYKDAKLQLKVGCYKRNPL